MKNTLRALFAFSTIGLSTLCANSGEAIRVSVPFSFMAGTTALPAGDYIVTEQASRVLMIRGARGGAIVLETSAGEDLREKSGLSFSHTDEGYFLREVHSFGKPSGILPVKTEAKK